MSLTTIPPMRLIVFSTLPPMAVNALLETLEAAGQHVLLLVTTPGPRTRPNEVYHHIIAEARRDLDIVVTSHLDRLPILLRGLAPDLLLVAGFPWRFPPALLALPRLGCVNAHPALLPRYRGPNPLFWQLMNGETQTGLTFHWMDADFDTGPMLLQRALDITSEDDVDSLFPKLLALGVPMIPEVLAAVAAGAPGIPQPSEGASYAPLCTEAERRLDWTCPATYLHNQIRGWGQEGARAEIDGHPFLVRRARVATLSPAMASSRSGTVLERLPEGMLVQTGQGALLLTEVASVDTPDG